MSDKLTFFLSAFILAVAFWACGDGSVYTPSDEDVYSVQKMTDSMDSLMKIVRKSCEADSACRERIELSGGWPSDMEISSSGAIESSPDKHPGDSSEVSPKSSSEKVENPGPNKDFSSSSVKPEGPKVESSSSTGPLPPEPPKKEESSSSKMGPPNPESSSSKVAPPDPKSSSEQPKSSSSSKPKSSSSSAEPLEPFDGTCSADRTTATTDETLTWNLVIPEGHEKKGKFKWHFDDDAEIVTNVEKDYRVTDVKIKGSSVEGEGTVPNSITVHYTKPGNKTGTYVSLGGKKVLCNSQKISITAGQGMQESSSSESSSSESSSSESSSSESSSSNPGGPGVLDDDSSSSANSSSSSADIIQINENPVGKTYPPGVYRINSFPDGRDTIVCNVHFEGNSNTIDESFVFSSHDEGNRWDNGQSGTISLYANVKFEFISGSLRFESCW